MNQRPAKGFTLVEILVALAIGALLLSGIIQVFTSLKRTDRVAEALSRVQEAGRTALDTLAFDLRMIGYKGCADPALMENIVIRANTPPTTDFIADSLRGFNVTANGWAVGTGLTGIDGGGTRQARLDSDVVSLMRASEESMVVTAHNNASSTITAGPNTPGLAVGDVAIISDCDNTDIFRVSAISGTSTTSVKHESSRNSSATLSKIYSDPNTRLMGFVADTYFVGDTGRKNIAGNTIHALYRRDQNGNVAEIVEGVENLQITYGQEFVNGNRRFVAAGTAGLNMSQVTSMKISVLVTSQNAVLDADDTQDYPMAGAVIEPAASGATLTYANDRRLRKVFTVTVNLRNRRVSL